MSTDNIVPWPQPATKRHAAPTRSEAAYLAGERAGYVLGARCGRGVGFCWGLLVGGGLVAGVLQLAYWAGL